ncbi:MAG: hypothetical protein U9N81_04425 [Bacillota bacterium]|nr:hypothetical protein [Bacillota bacterium]
MVIADLFSHQEGFVFTADINLDTKPFYAMVDSDVDDFIESIEKLRRLQPDMLVAGHGKAVMTGNLSQRLAVYRDNNSQSNNSYA